jgi:hypothetical protein
MEAMLVGKPRSVAIGVLRALVVPLKEHWGAIELFREAGLDVLAKEGGGTLYDEKNSPAHLEQLYRQVQRARATSFRAIESSAQLDQLHKELDLSAAKAASPLQQGVLWLASRLQQQAIAYLQQPAAQEQIAKVLAAIAQQREGFGRLLGKTDQLTLERVEEVLAEFAQQSLGGALGAFERTALAGHLLEKVREAGRRPRKLDVSNDDAPRNDAMTALLAVFMEPVRQGELNEAKLRYARLSEEEKTKRYNEFRRNLQRIIGEVAPAAAEGFESFCDAIERRMYPYPEPLQFIRTYARPIWNNGAQSNVFANATTPQSVEHAYEQAAKAKQGNPVTLEIAKAIALNNFRQASRGKAVNLGEINLKSEFGWPSTVAELKTVI